MSGLRIGRLLVGPPSTMIEQVGDPAATLGGAVVPGTRTAPQHQIQVGTWAADGQTDSVAARLTIRRQLRSLLNNSPLKYGYAFIYLQFQDDPEENGWYVPDQTSLTDIVDSVGLATGLWLTSQQNWFQVGRRRTHREARQIWLKDLRTGLYARDHLGWVYSTDFAALPALAVTVFPDGATSLQDNTSGHVIERSHLGAGRDGGAALWSWNAVSDLQVVSFERPEAAFGLTDVVAYDRVGQLTNPSSGPDTAWVEMYGPDWPYSWQADGASQDTPVLDNGLVRVRYDAAVGWPGLRIDMWSGTGYEEQGKVTFYRFGDTGSPVDTWVSANLVEWTPERAVMLVVLACSDDGFSRERVYVTVQRGEPWATVGYYPATVAAGTPGDASFRWTPTVGDVNDSVIKVDSHAQPAPAGDAFIAATAGTGTQGLPAGAWASTFAASQNWLAYLRCGSAYTPTHFQHNLVVAQAAASAVTFDADTSGYGTATSGVAVRSNNNAGWCSLRVGFVAAQPQQVLEAELMKLASGTTVATDAAASNDETTTATRTSAGLHVSQGDWPDGFYDVEYRVFARVKVSAGTASVYAATSDTTGTTVTTTSTAYTWLDLGTIVSQGTLSIYAWVSSGSGTVSVDRLEAFYTHAHGAWLPLGAEDMGQAALYDSRQLGAVVAR